MQHVALVLGCMRTPSTLLCAVRYAMRATTSYIECADGDADGLILIVRVPRGDESA